MRIIGLVPPRDAPHNPNAIQTVSTGQVRRNDTHTTRESCFRLAAVNTDPASNALPAMRGPTARSMTAALPDVSLQVAATRLSRRKRRARSGRHVRKALRRARPQKTRGRIRLRWPSSRAAAAVLAENEPGHPGPERGHAFARFIRSARRGGQEWPPHHATLAVSARRSFASRRILSGGPHPSRAGFWPGHPCPPLVFPPLRGAPQWPAAVLRAPCRARHPWPPSVFPPLRGAPQRAAAARGIPRLVFERCGGSDHRGLSWWVRSGPWRFRHSRSSLALRFRAAPSGLPSARAVVGRAMSLVTREPVGRRNASPDRACGLLDRARSFGLARGGPICFWRACGVAPPPQRGPPGAGARRINMLPRAPPSRRVSTAPPPVYRPRTAALRAAAPPRGQRLLNSPNSPTIRLRNRTNLTILQQYPKLPVSKHYQEAPW